MENSYTLDHVKADLAQRFFVCLFVVFCEVIIGISHFQLPFASSLYLKLELSQLIDTLGEGKCRHGF